MTTDIPQTRRGNMTKSEAAKFLDVTERTINNYINKGYLTRTYKDGIAVLENSEVQELKLAQDSGQKLDAVIFNKLQYQVQRQERELNIIKRILNIYHEPLNMSDTQLLYMYKSASFYSAQPWPEGWETEWPDIISRLSEQDLLNLERLTGDEHPWLRFYTLLNDLRDLVKNKDYLELINYAQQHIRLLGSIWIKKKGQDVELLKTAHPSEFSDKVITTLIAKKQLVKKH